MVSEERWRRKEKVESLLCLDLWHAREWCEARKEAKLINKEMKLKDLMGRVVSCSVLLLVYVMSVLGGQVSSRARESDVRGVNLRVSKSVKG